ncbi:MAG: DUF3137 domain-containing protein [Blastocatellia bacterium]|nr:MAG: DUF3137 domain-containing protein [Blastocatellia bacterium]
MGTSQTFEPTDGVWSQLAKEIGGQFLNALPDYYYLGGIGPTVHLKVEEWSIVLEGYKQSTPDVERRHLPEIIRMRAPYNDKDSFRFIIWRKNLLSGLGKILGMQDVEIGDPGFDDEFIIQCNDEVKLRALFANARIKQLLHSQPYVFFQNREGESQPSSTLLNTANTELYFLPRYDQTQDCALLKSLFELFSETLRQLRSIGSA